MFYEDIEEIREELVHMHLETMIEEEVDVLGMMGGTFTQIYQNTLEL